MELLAETATFWLSELGITGYWEADRPSAFWCRGRSIRRSFLRIDELGLVRIDRDRGTPRDAAPPSPPGIRVPYHGGSTGLSLGRVRRLRIFGQRDKLKADRSKGA